MLSINFIEIKTEDEVFINLRHQHEVAQQEEIKRKIIEKDKLNTEMESRYNNIPLSLDSIGNLNQLINQFHQEVIFSVNGDRFILTYITNTVELPSTSASFIQPNQIEIRDSGIIISSLQVYQNGILLCLAPISQSGNGDYYIYIDDSNLYVINLNTYS